MYLGTGPIDPMTKLTFYKGKGDQVFVAAGAHYKGTGRYVDYEITGQFGPQSADGRIPVQFKMTYKAADWSDAEMEGMFDPEENSLRGTSSGKLVPPGEFVFRGDPDFVRFYPSPSFINARKRDFALTSVLERIRRQVWSPRQISKRIKDRKRYMELVLRRHYGRNLTMEEAG